MGCSSRAAAAGLTGEDCCIGRIRDSNVACDDSGEAPCLIDTGKRFKLLLFIATSWNIARGTLHLIYMLFVTRYDQSHRSLLRLGAVRPSSEKLDLWRLIDRYRSQETSTCFIFRFWLLQNPASADAVPSSVGANEFFVELISKTALFLPYNRLTTLG